MYPFVPSGEDAPPSDRSSDTTAFGGETYRDVVPEWIDEEVRLWFGVDVRALAAFRIGLGLLVVADLVIRGRQLRTFYTDAGVLPRGVLDEQFPVLATLSFHTVSGDFWV